MVYHLIFRIFNYIKTANSCLNKRLNKLLNFMLVILFLFEYSYDYMQLLPLPMPLMQYLECYLFHDFTCRAQKYCKHISGSDVEVWGG